MENDLLTKRPFTTITSWMALLIALGCLGFIAWYIPTDRQVHIEMFRDFGMRLPTSTKLMLAIPDAAFPTTAMILACILVGLQWFTRSKSGAMVMHMSAIVFCCMVFAAYRESLFQPLSSLIRGVSGNPAGG